MESVDSIRGGELKIVEGFVYVKKHNLAGGWCAFECEKRRYCNGTAGQCTAKLKVKGDQFEKVGEHTHAIDVGRAEMLIAKHRIKRRAMDTMETPQQITADGVMAMSQGNHL